MELTKRINFRQPKYMIPALIYFPLIFTAYFVIDAFGTKKAETVDPSMQTTEYLNPNLPQAKVKDDLDGKYESMLKSWGKIDDYSAVGNIDRDDDGAATETYERQVSEEEAEAMESAQGAMPPGSVEETLRRSAERGEAVASGDYPFPLTESERQSLIDTMDDLTDWLLGKGDPLGLGEHTDATESAVVEVIGAIGAILLRHL